MQNQIDAINERLNAGENKFGEVANALSKIALHLENQDAAMAAMAEKIDRNGESTESILEMWNGGVKTVRFFCRCAEAWRFFIKEMLIPVFIPMALIVAVYFYFHTGELPKWAGILVKLFG